MNKPTGGPAFPQSDVFASGKGGTIRCQTPDTRPTPGMTLRGWFAGQALSAEKAIGEFDLLAKHCYDIADAMIAQRGK